MSTPFEEAYLDVLQNIEFAIIQVYRGNPDLDLIDNHVDGAIAGLVRVYQAEQRGKAAPKLKLSEASQRVYDSVRAMCEWRLGRAELDLDPQPEMLTEDAEQGLTKTPEEIVACLKRIRKSVKTMGKSGGRTGYLDYINQFLP